MRYEANRSISLRTGLLYAGLVILGGGAFALLFVVGTVVGLIAVAVAGYIIYQVAKQLYLQRNSYVDTHDDGMTGRTAAGETVRVGWSELSHAGTFTDERGRYYAFVYSESSDTLLTLPDDYSNFEQFLEELAEHIELSDYRLGTGESIERRLQQELAAQEQAESGQEQDGSDSGDSEDS